MSPQGGGHHAPREYWASNLHTTSSGIPLYDPSLNMQVKWLASCTTLVSTRLLKLSSTFKRARLKMKYYCHIWVGAVQSSFFSSDRVQKASTSPWSRIIFYPSIYRQDVASLSSLLPRKVLRRTTVLGSAWSNLYGNDPPYHLHCSKPSTFPPYSICKKFYLNRPPPSWTTALWNQLPRGCPPPNYYILNCWL